jgi:cytochrome b561
MWWCGSIAFGVCVCVRFVWRGVLDCSPAYLSTQNARTHTKRYAAASHLTFYILNILLNSVTLTRNIRAP